MKLVTLRNLPPALSRVIRRRAEEKRVSLNKAVINLLEERVGPQRKKKRPLYHDLDSLAGSWTKEEARGFEKTLAQQRGIDPDLWK
ncbi:MAG: hypothetical protein HZA23_07585 [Nitrospirae bacterium]|nr:hypothetical protein [Nitrospirota bacterium]